MATPTPSIQSVYRDALVNYLVSMARTVEGSVNRALDALLGRRDPGGASLTGEIFLVEPRINEMEIVIDEHAIRMLRSGNLPEDEVRLIVAALRVNNDLERMGDLAVNIAERVLSLAQMPPAEPPPELEPMAAAVRVMVRKSLGALIHRNVVLAGEVLESDDVVDHYRDQAFERLLAGMTADSAQIPPNLQFVLATRYLERIADHATNVAEDIIFWVRGLDVRHGRGLAAQAKSAAASVTQNSSSRDATLNVPE